MARKMTFDFTDAPPAQGGQSSDHVMPGRHTLRLVDFSETQARSSGNKMIVTKFEVASGPDQGKQLIDRFVTTGESKFGLQRLHAFFLALNLPVTQKKVALDVDRLIGQLVVAQVVDEVVPANDNYPERLQSKINAYYLVEGATPPTPAAVAAPQEPAPAPAPAVVEAPAPAAVAAAAAPAAPAAEVSVADVDDLFA